MVPSRGRAGRRGAPRRRALLAGEDPDADASDPRTQMRAVFRDGLAPAIRTDPVVLRAFFRSLNLLTAPDALVKDADVGARVLAVWNDRENRPPEPGSARRPGPSCSTRSAPDGRLTPSSR